MLAAGAVGLARYGCQCNEETFDRDGRLRKMMPMRAGPVGQTSGPFVLPARVILLIAGLLAMPLASFDVLQQFLANQVNGVYTIVALAVVTLWLVAVVMAFFGSRPATFFASAVAFVEFAVVASSRFETGVMGLTQFVQTQGLPVVTVDMALLVICAIVFMSAVIAWSNPRGRNRRLDTLPLLMAATIGSILVILQATDDFHRSDFGKANPEDGAFAAALLAMFWMTGGLWISRARRIGALLIAASTFGVWYSFVSLHLLKGGITVIQIAERSGAAWAGFAAGAAILAAASFFLAIGVFAWSFVPRKRASTEASQPVRKGA